MSDLEVVIASYGEDLTWVGNLRVRTHVYNAKAGRTDLPDGVISVPNIAREASQYLFYLASNHHRLSEWTAFLQGNPFDHTHDAVERVNQRLFLGCEDRPIIPLGYEAKFGFGHPHDFWAFNFYKEWSGRDLPLGGPWPVGAQFVVHRNVLTSRPVGYYQDLLVKVMEEADVSPWAMERLWMQIL